MIKKLIGSCSVFKQHNTQLKKHWYRRPEVGAGATFAGKKLDIFDYGEDDTNSVFGTASFMYRGQPKEGGFSWRIGFTPIIASGIFNHPEQ